jgi:hypothetical protein
MRYEFTCDHCGTGATVNSRAFCPPKAPACVSCKATTRRLYGCQIDTSGCRDPDDIPEKDRIACGGAERNLTSGQADRIEAQHQAHNEATRAQLRDGNRGSFKKTMQIPASLFHGKIKQTKDPNYWDDPQNRNRHKSCRVDR